MSSHAPDCGLACGLDECDCGQAGIVSVWDAIFSFREWGRYPAEDLIRFVCREQAVKASLKALEVGCGPGANLCFLASRGIEFDALDTSRVAVTQALGRLDREFHGWKGRVREGDLCALPQDFAGHDIAIDSEALSCNGFDESAVAIRQIHARLKPGGAFWSRTFATGTWPGTFAECGPIRMTERAEIDRLYEGWASVAVGEITRHDGDPEKIVREWIIVARKH